MTLPMTPADELNLMDLFVDHLHAYRTDFSNVLDTQTYLLQNHNLMQFLPGYTECFL